MHNTYRIKVWYLLLSFAIALITLSTLAGAAAMFIVGILFMVFLFRDGHIGTAIFLIVYCGLVLFASLLLIAFGIILPLGNALFSYLSVDSTGLELRIWPSYRLRCHWNQVSRLEHVKLLAGRLSLPMLRFEEAEIKSWRDRKWYLRLDHTGLHSEFVEYPASFGLGLLALLLWSVEDKNLIPVYIFNGWPNGKLKRDLEIRLGPIL